MPAQVVPEGPGTADTLLEVPQPVLGYTAAKIIVTHEKEEHKR